MFCGDLLNGLVVEGASLGQGAVALKRLHHHYVILEFIIDFSYRLNTTYSEKNALLGTVLSELSGIIECVILALIHVRENAREILNVVFDL